MDKIEVKFTTGENSMTLGAIAILIVEDPKVLNDPIIHRVPTKIMVERMKLEIKDGR